jgi:hypothetical protein
VPPAPAPFDEGDLLARAFDADCVAPNSLAKLARYEGAIERSLDRTLRQLKAFQSARNTSDASPQPDVSPAAKASDPPETKPPTTPDSAPTPPPNIDYEANPKNEGSAPRANPGDCTSRHNPPEKASQNEYPTNGQANPQGELC